MFDFNVGGLLLNFLYGLVAILAWIVYVRTVMTMVWKVVGTIVILWFLLLATGYGPGFLLFPFTGLLRGWAELKTFF